MSRGSYQRRVQITALMCNEGYLWHETHMETFTGDVPGYWTKKMFSEKTRALELTRRARKSPNYSRRSKNALREKEVDYGEEAVEAAENAARETMVIDINTMRNKYKVVLMYKLTETLNFCLSNYRFMIKPGKNSKVVSLSLK